MRTVPKYIVAAISALSLASCATGPIRHELKVSIEKSLRFTVTNRTASTVGQPVFASSISTQDNVYIFSTEVKGRAVDYGLTTRGTELPVEPGDTLEVRYMPMHAGEETADFTLPDGQKETLSVLYQTIYWIVPANIGEKTDIKACGIWTADGRDGLNTVYDASGAVTLLLFPR